MTDMSAGGSEHVHAALFSSVNMYAYDARLFWPSSQPLSGNTDEVRRGHVQRPAALDLVGSKHNKIVAFSPCKLQHLCCIIQSANEERGGL